MASSAVSSLLFVHSEAGNHAETSIGAHIYNGDAASFHDWEFRSRPRIAGKTGDRNGLHGDAFVAAQEVGLKNLLRNYRWKTKRYQHADQSHARNGFSLD